MLALARTLWRKLRKMRFSYEPLIEVRISREAILHNLAAFQNFKMDMAVAPVLKANAYGHGLVEVAKVVDREDVPFACVDSYFEALILRNEGFRAPILVVGYTPLENILGSRLERVAFGILSADELYRLAKNARERVAIHLKIDTGMRRHGVTQGGIEEAIALLKANPRLALQGLYTHLADADTPGSAHAARQIEEWNAAVERFRAAIPGIAYFHCAATSGAALAKTIDANVMRLGIGLYGFGTGGEPLPLRPALEMVTRITSVRPLKKGESVGYNAAFTAPRDMQIATIPAGYYEGVDRRLSNHGAVLTRDTPCPIVGRVSMNITSFDISHLPGVGIGEEAVVISVDESAPNCVKAIAKTCETIPYEILVRVPAHLRRVVV